MANQSIFNAFERMRYHIVNALNNKSDIGHKHKIDDITDLENSSNIFYINCINTSFDDSYTDGLCWKISCDKTFSEIKAAIKEGKTPVATFTWIENDVIFVSFTLTQYSTDIDGDFIYFNGTSSDHLNNNVSNLKITICNPNPTHTHNITENIFTATDLELNTSSVQSDWNQNDENESDYIKNRTHYKYFGTIMSEQQVTFTEIEDLPMPAYVHDNALFECGDPGDKYIVTLDGTVHNLTMPDIDEGGPIIGNPILFLEMYRRIFSEGMGRELTIEETLQYFNFLEPYNIDNGLSFAIIPSDGTSELAVLMREEGTHTLKIEGTLFERLDERYIVKSYAKKSDLTSKIDKPSMANVGQVIAVKTVDSYGTPMEFEAIDMQSGGNGSSNEIQEFDLTSFGTMQLHETNKTVLGGDLSAEEANRLSEALLVDSARFKIDLEGTPFSIKPNTLKVVSSNTYQCEFIKVIPFYSLIVMTIIIVENDSATIEIAAYPLTIGSSGNSGDSTGGVTLPEFTEVDNGKVLGIVDGQLAWVSLDIAGTLPAVEGVKF